MDGGGGKGRESERGKGEAWVGSPQAAPTRRKGQGEANLPFRPLMHILVLVLMTWLRNAVLNLLLLYKMCLLTLFRLHWLWCTCISEFHPVAWYGCRRFYEGSPLRRTISTDLPVGRWISTPSTSYDHAPMTCSILSGLPNYISPLYFKGIRYSRPLEYSWALRGGH